MVVHERLLLPNLGNEGAVFMVGCVWAEGLCNCCISCPSSRHRMAAVMSPLHMQDWVVEHWDKMPRYGEVVAHEPAPCCSGP